MSKLDATPIPDTRPKNPLRDDTEAFAEVHWHPDFIVIFGPIPVARFSDIAKRFRTKGAVIDMVLAEKFGATLVVARSEKISAKARAVLTPPAAHGSGLSAWLAGPDVGMSSRFMARHLLGKATVPVPDRPGAWRDWVDQIYYPLDASDLRRCFKLIEAVPELAPRIGEMSAVSAEWGRIVSVWRDCEKLYYGQPDDPNKWWQPITDLIQQPRPEVQPTV
jgi:hypothetical protein